MPMSSVAGLTGNYELTLLSTLLFFLVTLTAESCNLLTVVGIDYFSFNFFFHFNIAAACCE